MKTPAGFREVRFRSMEEFAAATLGRTVYTTPHNVSGVLGGIRVFALKDGAGKPTGEWAVYVADETAQ